MKASSRQLDTHIWNSGEGFRMETSNILWLLYMSRQVSYFWEGQSLGDDDKTIFRLGKERWWLRTEPLAWIFG